MSSVRPSQLPATALLRDYQSAGAYADCYVTDVRLHRKNQVLAHGCSSRAGRGNGEHPFVLRVCDRSEGGSIYPDIVALNQIALSYEMIGEVHSAREYFTHMKQQALEESNSIYAQAAELGLNRLR